MRNMFYILAGTLLLIVGRVYADGEESDMLPIIQPLSEIIGDVSPIQASVSPNGEWVAWYQLRAGICLYHIESESRNCYDWPPEEATLMSDNMFFNQPSFNWSPDSTKLSFSRNINYGVPFDSDIWIFDVSSSSWHNMTDDRFWGIALPDGMTGTDADMDTLPTWLSAEHILFIRFATQVTPFNARVDGWRRNPRLMQLDVATGEVEVVLDLSEDFFPNVPILSTSPDGRYIALWLYHTDTSTTALWLYDQESQQFDSLFTDADIRSVSDIEEAYLYPVDIIWTKSGDMLLSLEILSASLRTEHYILMQFSPQSGQLHIISGDLAVHSSAYHAETDMVYFNHIDVDEERVTSISRVLLSDSTIHLLQENTQPLPYPSDGQIRYFSQGETVILNSSIWVELP